MMPICLCRYGNQVLDDRLLGIANYYLENKKFHYKNRDYYKTLFSNNSIIDKYFCEMINMWKI